MIHQHHLTNRQHAGLIKAGKCLLPDKHFPVSFNDAEKRIHIDHLLKKMDSADLIGFKLLLTLLSFLPISVLHSTLRTLHRYRKGHHIFAPIIRKALLGIQGVVYSIYYTKPESSPTHNMIRENMKWDSKIVTEDQPEDQYHSIFSQDLNPLSQNRDTKFLSHFQIKDYQPPSIQERLLYLWTLHDWILDHMDEITHYIQQETGKTKNEILFTEIFSSLENIRWLIKSKKALDKEKVKTPLLMMGKKSYIQYQPLGRVLIITAWNYPFYQAIQGLTTSFFCGNQTILKPSEVTPLHGILQQVVDILPEHALHVEYGDGETAKKIINDRPEKIFFTGSSATGRKIMQQASHHLIPIELELGGKDAAIVFADAHLDRAVPGLLWGSCVTSGQACSATEMIFIQQEIFEDFKHQLVTLAKSITPGDERLSEDHIFDYGPIILEKQVKKIKEHLDDALEKGACLLTGSCWDGVNPIIPPLVLEHVTEDMLVMKEESFGPFLPIKSFQSVEEAICLINKTNYGLSASIWGENKENLSYTTSRLRVGSLSINNVMASEANHNLPFGGIRESGFGRHKGLHGIHGFLHLKSVMEDKNSKKNEVNWFPATQEQLIGAKGMIKNFYMRSFLSKFSFIKHGMRLEKLAEKNRKNRTAKI